jgi:cytochrome P450
MSSTQTAPIFPSGLFGPLPFLRRDPLNFLFKATEQCGDVARVEFAFKPHVAHLIRHPLDVEHVLVSNARNYVKQTRGYEKLRLVLGEGLVTSDGEFWKRQRRIAQPAFHKERIARLAPIMTAATEEMLAQWAPRVGTGQAFDVAEEMSRLTLKIIGQTMLSTDVSSAASEVGQAVTVALNHAIRRTTNVFSLPEVFPTPANLLFRRSLDTLDRVVLGMISERRKDGHDRGDLLSMLMAARDEETGEGMTDHQLRDEVMTIFLAGHETTANALSWTFYLLSLHPDVDARLREELAQVLGGRPPRLEDLPRLPYVDQVLKEAMRLFPPVWMIARRSVEEDVLSGFKIPAGTFVFMSPYLTHRHPAFWPNPEGFDPSRFAPGRLERLPRCAYFPFSKGPRMCIGDQFALLEGRLVLATLLQRVRLSLAPGYRASPLPTVTLRPKDGVRMTLTPADPIAVAPAAAVA